ncbi:MAG: hypothetical protein JWR72_700 [Flavisolibacter sp.]|jgi:capsular exopolysaccharide synthesis family protein|nr:hypothetical protein [Flavisolibacter sp.]
MKNEFQSLIQMNGTKSSKSLKDTVLSYLYYWPLFLISLFLFLGVGYVYIRYTVPLYEANTIINVRGETTTSRSTQGSSDLINTAMNGGRSAINLDNELGRLRSARLMSMVVRNSDLNVSYYLKGRLNETDVYHNAPFRLIPKDIQDSSRSIKLTLTKFSNQDCTIQYGDDGNPTTKTVPWNQPFAINGNTFSLTPQAGLSGNETYLIRWNSVLATVYELIPKVSVNVIGKTSNIALNVTIENAKRGEDVLNKMVAAFIQMNLDDQNRNAQDKIYFIEDRLGKLSDELKGVEKNMAAYQGSNLIVEGASSGTYGTPVGEAQKAVDNIATQKSIMSMIKTSLTSSQDKVLPSGGTTDGVLGSLISNYNQALLKKQSLVSQVAPGSLILKDIDDQIANFRTGILDNLNNNMKALDLQASNFSRQGSQFRSSVSGLPEKQRLLGEIAREKSIKESLYLYLLQKREETALSKTTTTPYEQIDAANAYGPVSPDHKAVYVYCSIIGLVMPVVVIFLIGMLNDKIKSKDEVENGATAQIVGEINFIKRSENKILPSLEGGIVGEQFRIMRANLNFLQKGARQQVILITSSGSGEGKSFVSLNLAAVLSKAGKKVALLDFDLRKPDESMPATLTEKGIKDYLMGEATLADIVQHVGELPSLHMYPSGRVIADVGDLIVSDKADELFNELSDKYDTIVINTPPVGLVGDALILQKYSTLIGFVIRESYTKKKQLQYLNSLMETGKFTNTCVIYNGIRTGMKYGYYGYGYTKNNAYFERNEKISRIAKVFKKKKSTTV